MPGQKCILCGKEYPAGLHVLGCLICFPCEKKLLLPGAALRMSAKRRHKLSQLAQAAQAESPMVHTVRRLS